MMFRLTRQLAQSRAAQNGSQLLLRSFSTTPRACLAQGAAPAKKSRVFRKLLIFTGIASAGALVASYRMLDQMNNDEKYQEKIKKEQPELYENLQRFNSFLKDYGVFEKIDSLKPATSPPPPSDEFQEAQRKRERERAKMAGERQIRQEKEYEELYKKEAEAQRIAREKLESEGALAVAEAEQAIAIAVKEEEERRMEALARQEAAEKLLQEKRKLHNKVSVVQDELADLAHEALEAQRHAAEAFKDHTARLRRALESGLADRQERLAREGGQGSEADQEEWTAVIKAKELAQVAADKAEKLQDRTMQGLEKLKTAISESKDTVEEKGKELLDKAEQAMHSTKQKLDHAVEEVKSARSEFSVVRDYQALVERAKDHFQQEMESVNPNRKLGSGWGGQLTEEELESLLAHAHSRILQLQHQMAQVQAFEDERISAAQLLQQEKDERAMADQIAAEKVQLYKEFEEERIRWGHEAELERDMLVTLELGRQERVHQLDIVNELAAQETILRSQFDQVLAERAEEIRADNEAAIQGSIARLRGIEEAVQARADTEVQGRKAQELWLACQTLENSLTHGTPNVEGKRKPLGRELAMIRAASNDHEFVRALVDTIPDQSVATGVWTLQELKDRFDKVYSSSRQVVLMGDEAGTVYKHLMSRFMSVFVKRYSPLDEAAEVTGETSQFLLLDTARYYVAKDDIQMALRFLNQLRGAARLAASDWLREARASCELQQAAACLKAHASAAGVGAL